jgi:class 3 adenylate cyclase
MHAETRFARAADGTHLAYQVTGAGPVDIVLLRAWYTVIEHEWEEPVLARILRRLGAMGRLIRLDRRGTGLSDRIVHRGVPTIEERLDDILAVMDAAGVRRAVLVGLAAGAPLCTVFAATHPDRTAGLVLYESPAPTQGPADAGPTMDQANVYATWLRERWATRELADLFVAQGAPSRNGDPHLASWLVDDFRLMGSPDDAAAMALVAAATDIAGALPAIHVPTLVTAREGSRADEARTIAARIDGARLAILPGADHMLLAGDTDAFLRELERFIGGLGSTERPHDRVLATLLFTDLVGSTERAVAMGDRAWAQLLERHHAGVREILARHRGREIDTAGDGFFATFDGPGRAILCALAVVDDARSLDLEVRAGIHAGEVEQVAGRLRGVAVHIGARVAAVARPSEVLATGTVRDLVAGSGLAFVDRGVHDLKGIPDPFRLWAVTGPRDRRAPDGAAPGATGPAAGGS